MTINNAARAHGHAYQNWRVNAPCGACGDRFGGLWLTCRYDNEDDAPRYWVLPFGGYPDTQADYIPANSRAQIHAMLPDYGWMENPGVHVFDGTREPWDEVDPYPDYLAEFGPRSGLRWERA